MATQDGQTVTGTDENSSIINGPLLPYPLEPIGLPPQQWKPFTPTGQPKSGPTFRIRGRIDFDTISVEQSAANKATFGNIPDVAGLRRARIGAEGHFSDESRYIAEIDLATGQVVIKDVFVGVGKIEETGEFKFGHMREPFSLEGGTSANTFAFMERSPINNLDPARNWGVGFTRCSLDEGSTMAIGVFKSDADSNDFGRGNGSDSAVTGKLTKLFWYEDSGASLMHVGVATSSRVPDGQFVVVSQRPASPLLDLSDSSESPFVPKLAIPASFEQLFNAQWAFVDGPLWSQAEWYGSVINQRDGQGVFIHGSYFSIGYFVTGEHRNYVKQSGLIGPVTVARPLLNDFSSNRESRPRGHGALEFTGRISYLDFSDPHLPTNTLGQPIGSTLPELTIGMNWYLADRFRIMFNYNYLIPDVSATGGTAASTLATRVAIFW